MRKLLYNSRVLLNRRRELRAHSTESEQKLWQYLANRKLGGLKFFRQYSVGPYILDFYCPKLRLAIELDGKVHEQTDAKIYDTERSQYLRSANIQELRFTNEEVYKNMSKVLEKIASYSPLK